MVGFIRRSLDLHRSKRERHRLLTPENLDTAVSHSESWWLHDAVEFRFEVKQGHYESVLCMHESSLLCRDVCLMSRMKFGSDTMLNILATRCVILCCIY